MQKANCSTYVVPPYGNNVEQYLKLFSILKKAALSRTDKILPCLTKETGTMDTRIVHLYRYFNILNLRVFTEYRQVPFYIKDP